MQQRSRLAFRAWVEATGVRAVMGFGRWLAAVALAVGLFSCTRSASNQEASGLGVVAGEATRLEASAWPAEHLVVTNSARFDQRARFVGDLAVTKAASGPVLAHNAELALEEDAKLTGNVRADTVYLADRATIAGSATYNGRLGSGVVTGQSSSPLSLPLPVSLPTLPSMTAGNQAVTLSSNEVRTLGSGSFGAVSLSQGNGGSKTQLRLSGGTYTFSALTLATDARVECLAPCVVQVVGRVLVAARSYLGPAAVAGLGPGNVQLLVKGTNGSAGPAGLPSALGLDNDSSLLAYTLVPNGTLSIGHRVALKGKVVARDLLLGIDLQGKGLQLPLITTHPADQQVWEGQAAEFSVTANGPDLTYQWQKNGVTIGGATSSTLRIPSAQLTDDGAEFRVAISNEAGTVLSAGATLTVWKCKAEDTKCDGVDEDCDGQIDDDFVPTCATGDSLLLCEQGQPTPSACSNGILCDGSEACESGACQPGPDPTDDGNPCTVGTCDEAAQSITQSPLAAGQACDDGDPTNGTDACDGAGACVPLESIAPVPKLVCVDSVGNGNFSAKFGYTSSLGTAIVIGNGSDNALQPTPIALLGDHTAFSPGDSEGAFRASFPAGSSITWSVFGNTATADEQSPRCPLEEAKQSPVPLGDGPRGHSSKVGPLQPYFLEAPFAFFSKNFSDPAGQVPDPVVGSRSVATQATPEELPAQQFSAQGVAPLTTVKLFLTSWQILRETDVAGGSDPAVVVTIDGAQRRTKVGSCTSKCGEDNLMKLLQDVEVDPSQPSVTLEINAVDEDPLGDERLFRGTITIDLAHDQTATLVASQFNNGNVPDVDMVFRLEVDNPLHFPKPTVTPEFELCVEWTTDFIDEGYGEDTIGPYSASFAEYRLVATGPSGPIVVGAERDPTTGAVVSGTPGLPGCDFQGACFLDAAGCVPTGVLDRNDFVHLPGDPSEGLEADLRVRTLFWDAQRKVGVHVLRATTAIAAPDYSEAEIDALSLLVETISTSSENGSFTTDSWGMQGPWKIPPTHVTFSNPTLHGMTHAASVASTVLTAKGLYLPSNVYRVVVGTGCRAQEAVPVTPAPTCTSDADCAGSGFDQHCFIPADATEGTCGCRNDGDCIQQRQCTASNRCGVKSQDSCAIGKTLSIGAATLPLDSATCTGPGQCPTLGQECMNPDGTDCVGAGCQCRWRDQARWKFVAAHEFGHVVKHAAVGSLAKPDYTFGCDVNTCGNAPKEPSTQRLFDPPMVAPACACNHVTAANRLHCLQSLERMYDAENEGFGHFIASAVFNQDTTQNDCTFVYYKEGLESSCPDESAFDCFTTPSGIKVLPPFPLSCAMADKWRNSRCGGTPGGPESTLAEMGVERDWMQFYRAWNTAGGPASASLEEIAEAWRQTCTPEACVGPDGAYVPGCSPPLCDFVAIDPSFPEELRQLIPTWATPVEPNFPAPAPGMPDSYKKMVQEAWRTYWSKRSLRDGVSTYYEALEQGGDSEADDRLDHFLQAAADRGVDEITTP